MVSERSWNDNLVLHLYIFKYNYSQKTFKSKLGGKQYNFFPKKSSLYIFQIWANWTSLHYIMRTFLSKNSPARSRGLACQIFLRIRLWHFLSTCKWYLERLRYDLGWNSPLLCFFSDRPCQSSYVWILCHSLSWFWKLTVVYAHYPWFIIIFPSLS